MIYQLHLSSYLLPVMLNKVKHLCTDSSLTLRMTGSVNQNGG